MATYQQARGARCDLAELRCYGPAVIAMLGLGVVIAWLTYAMQGFDLALIGTRHYLMGFLLWMVMTPVIFGVLRGTRRSLRHLSRRG